MRWVPVTIMRRMMRGAGAGATGAAADGAAAGGVAGAVGTPGVGETAGSCAAAGVHSNARLRQADVVRSKPFFRATIRMSVRQTRLWALPGFRKKTGKADGSEKIQAGYVIPGRQEHQSQHHNQPKPKSDILDALAQRPPQNCFACIV